MDDRQFGLENMVVSRRRGFSDENPANLVIHRRCCKEWIPSRPSSKRQPLRERIAERSARSQLTPSSRSLIDILWHDLPHPPTSYLGNNHKWRSADGSGNSLTNPQLGAARTRECSAAVCGCRRLTSLILSLRSLCSCVSSFSQQSARPQRSLSPSVVSFVLLADRRTLQVVFDALLKRDTFKPHPSGISWVWERCVGAPS